MWSVSAHTLSMCCLLPSSGGRMQQWCEPWIWRVFWCFVKRGRTETNHWRRPHRSRCYGYHVSLKAAWRAAALCRPPSIFIIHTCGSPSSQRVGKPRATYRVWIMKVQTAGDTPTSWEETRVPPPPPPPPLPPPAPSREGSDQLSASEQKSQWVCIKRRSDFIFSNGEWGCEM